MADLLVINGYRTDDPDLGPVMRARYTLNLTFNGQPVDKVIENVFVKVSQDLKASTAPLLEGDTASGLAEILVNDGTGTKIQLNFTIADTALLDSSFSNQRYILQVDVLWDDETMDRIYDKFITFNPGI